MSERSRQLGALKESMLQGSPFPKLHAKAAETKALLKPVSAALLHFEDQDPSQREVLHAIVKVLDDSHSIDELVAGMNEPRVLPQQGRELEHLVTSLNVGTTKLCHFFHKKQLMLFNFVPKNHYLFHLAQLGRHMSPKLAWCYSGEDLMHKVKVLAQGSFRGTRAKHLGNKVIAKYLVGLSQALSS